MSMEKVMAIKAVSKMGGLGQDAKGFKAIMEQKRINLEKPFHHQTASPKPNETNLKTIISEIVKNHEAANQSIKTFMTRTDYSPEKLLTVQYQTGVLFLREQMFCKTVELSANTFKNFTQMQV